MSKEGHIHIDNCSPSTLPNTGKACIVNHHALNQAPVENSAGEKDVENFDADERDIKKKQVRHRGHSYLTRTNIDRSLGVWWTIRGVVR